MNKNLLKLEYDKILDIVSSYCKTYIGKKYVAELRPSHNKSDVLLMLKETNQGVILIQRNSTPPIDDISDITVSLKALESCGYLGIKALLEIKNILVMSANLKEYFDKDFLDCEDFECLRHYFYDLYVNPSIVSIFSKSIIDEETIADSASAKLQDIRRRKRNVEQDIRSKLNNFIHSPTYSKYIQENIITIRNDRFVIPVKDEYRSQIKGFVHDISSSGSTVFVEPIVVFDLNNELSNLVVEENLEIERILQNLSGLLFPYTNEFQNNVNIIGMLYFIFAKAKFSLTFKCTTPEINDSKLIKLINARHPLIPQEQVVPISLEIGKDFSVLIITGPNTGGKTVSLKTVGLLTAMACSGLDIPADEHSSIYVFDYIFADIGDEQSIAASLSTFSSHIRNIVDITNLATKDSLILVDELGSGTDPLEGSHLAISILQYFSELGAITVSTSHYQELKKYALVTQNFKNASVEFDVESLKPTYRLLIGVPGKSNAFAISRKLGLSESIISRASNMIDSDTTDFEDVLKSVYDEKIQLENEREKLDLKLKEVEEIKKNLLHQNDEVLSKEKDLIANAKQEAKDILVEAKETANLIIKELNSSSSSSQANKLRNKLNEKINGLKPEATEFSSESIARELIKPNSHVFVSTLNSDGIVLSNISKDDTVQVQVGIMKVKVNIKFLQRPKNSSTNNDNIKHTPSSSFKTQSVSPELNILGLTVDEAVPLVDKYLDDCFIAKLSPIRIVHGKGTGALRNGIHKFLKTNKHVASFRLGTFGEGEMGVTVVELNLK